MKIAAHSKHYIYNSERLTHETKLSKRTSKTRLWNTHTKHMKYVYKRTKLSHNNNKELEIQVNQQKNSAKTKANQ